MPAETESVHRTLRVLLVEDNQHLVGLFRAMLARATIFNVDLDLQTAADGLEAMARLAESRFDAVIVDVYLPKLDGAAVIRRARDELGLVDVPFIAVSAGGEQAQTQALAAGASSFLEKPVRIQQLTDTLLRLCPPRTNGA